jgi:hypothetical protein
LFTRRIESASADDATRYRTAVAAIAIRRFSDASIAIFSSSMTDWPP